MTGTVWRNWAGNQSSSARTEQPRDEIEVQAIIARAHREGERVRPAGSGHSFTALVPSDGLIIDTRSLSGVYAVDTVRRRARVGAGTLISELGEPLWSSGLALANQGDIDKQTIAGAAATGTHGSGRTLGSLSSYVTAVRLVDAAGEVVEFDETDLAALQCAQVHLGTLGVVTELELQLVDAYHLREEVTYPSWDQLQATLGPDVESSRHYSYLWLPHADSAALYELDAPSDIAGDMCYRKRYEVARIVEPDGIDATPDRRVDRSYRIYPGSFDLVFHELEYFIPAEKAAIAVRDMRELMSTAHPEQRYPLEVRWVKGDFAALSPTAGADSVSLSVSGQPGTNYEPFFHDVHQTLSSYGARPHWGKLHRFDAEDIASLYPRLPDFLALRAAHDPRGMFLNPHLRSLFGL